MFFLLLGILYKVCASVMKVGLGVEILHGIESLHKLKPISILADIGFLRVEFWKEFKYKT